METTKMTTVAVLTAAASGLLGYWGGASYSQVVVVDVPAEAAEIKTADKDVLLAEATNAGAKAEIKCSVGVISNHPERCYCTDGATAGWLTRADDCKAEITISDGKVYGRDDPEAVRK